MHPFQGLASLRAREPGSGLVYVLIDTPKGSRNKYKYDEQLGLYRLSKVLPMGASFPYDFGYIPSTRAEDGDPLDILILGEEPLFPGCLVTVRLVGVIQAEQTESGRTFRNDRLVGAIETPLNRPDVDTLADLGAQRLAEIEHFFIAYNQAEGRQFTPISRHGPEVAEQCVTDGIRQFEAAKDVEGLASCPGRGEHNC
jgi:inorganic pyrophosphatase